MKFIVLRFARDEIESELSKICVESILQFYPDSTILVVDDHSPIEPIFDHPNVVIQKSEFEPGKGELLGWYYFWKMNRNDPEEFACVLHDSMCLTGTLPTTSVPARLWSFQGSHLLGNHGEFELVSKLNPHFGENMRKNMHTWTGCFGLCAILPWFVIDFLHTNFCLFDLFPFIRNRTDRMALERIFGWALTISNATNQSLFGDIHGFPHAFYETTNPIEVMKAHQLLRIFPVVKIWRGR